MWIILENKIWWFHAITSLLFLSLLPMTKMFHIIASVINIFYTNLIKRGQIRPMHVSSILENPDSDIENISLGANKISDFSWKQLLDSVACTECARCTTVCPASRTDKPLSPMKIITDIRHKLYAETLNLNDYDGELVGGLISETELWACTTCGACMEECPVMIEHVPTIIDMRRHLVLSEGKPPEQAKDSLEKTLQNGNPWGMPQHERTKWADDFNLDLPTLADKKEVDVLYWVGCAGSYDPRNQGIARDLVKILKNANIDFAILGKEETCTGDSARRLGEEYLFETLANQNIKTLNKYKFNTVITACPHCFQVIAKEYKDFGGDYNVVHHSEYIQKLIDEEKIKVSPSIDGTITYHDACYLGRYNDIYEAPRTIIESLLKEDGKIVEMKDNKSSSLCCGAGGGMMWHDSTEGERINTKRFEQAVDTQADIVATACSFCAIMMDDAKNVTGNENTMQTLDVAELVAKSIE
jgi:Fe-S oxidoreductase